MRLVAVCMAKNEADIIEAFVRHTLRRVDSLLILDHDSTDATPRILQALSQEGLAVSVRPLNTQDFQQAKMTTLLAQEAFVSHAADWVLPLDADEFLRVPSRAALEDLLQAHAGAEALSLAWPTYVADPDAPSEPHPVRRLSWRVESSHRTHRKCILSKLVLRHPAFGLFTGNHWHLVGRPGAVKPGPSVPVDPDRLSLAHLPLRSVEQLTSKALIGWLSCRLNYMDRPELQKLSWHWRHLFELIRSDTPITPARVRDMAIAIYALDAPPERPPDPGQYSLIKDPLPVEDELRYTPERANDPVKLLADWANQLVTATIRARQASPPQGTGPAGRAG